MNDYKVTEIYEPKDNSNHWLMQLLDRPIAYHRIFARMTGSVTAGVMLSQAFYWSKLPTVQKRGGWFYKSATEWEEETCLSAQEQRTARKRLSAFDWWQEDKRKANGAPTIHYRINLSVFTDELAKLAQQMESPESTNGIVDSGQSIDLLLATNPINREYTENTIEKPKHEPVLTNPWDDEDDDAELRDKVFKLINDNYVTAFDDLRGDSKGTELDNMLSPYIAMAERYGFETLVRAFMAAKADKYRDALKPKSVEHFINADGGIDATANKAAAPTGVAVAMENEY